MEDNLYNLEDEFEGEVDRKTNDYSMEYSLEDSVEDSLNESLEDEFPEEEEMWNGQVEEKSDKRRALFLMMLKSMFSPVEGFKSIRRLKISSEKFASECFYPLITLASVSTFSELFYDSDSTFTSTMIEAVVIFISIFFGYFSTMLCGKWLLLKQPAAALSKEYGKIFVMTGFCSLCLFYILFRIYPLLAPVWGMLPIWTIYIIWKGTKFLGTREKDDTRTKVILSVLTVIAPIAWYWIFSEILPQ